MRTATPSSPCRGESTHGGSRRNQPVPPRFKASFRRVSAKIAPDDCRPNRTVTPGRHIRVVTAPPQGSHAPAGAGPLREIRHLLEPGQRVGRDGLDRGNASITRRHRLGHGCRRRC